MKTRPKKAKKYSYTKDCKEQPREICDQCEKKSIQPLCDMEERLTCKYIPKEQCHDEDKQYCLSSSWHCSLGMYLQVSLSSMSHKGWMDFFHDHLFHLVAVLLVLVLALLLGDVLVGEPLLHVTQRLDGLLLALVADLPGLLLAVLGVAVLLGFLGTSLHLQLADLLGLEVTILLLDWEGEDVGKLLTVPVDIGLAHLNLNLSWNVITILLGSSRTYNLFLTVAIVLGCLLPLAIELNGIRA